MDARDAILTRLRTTLAEPDLRFPPPDPSPLTGGERMAVTQVAGDRWALAERFVAELGKLYGTSEIVETETEARLAALGRLATWVEEEQAQRRVDRSDLSGDRDLLVWQPEHLLIDGLGPALTDVGFRMIVPQDLHDPTERETIRTVRAGITGVEAAFASTGTLLMAGSPGRSRVASLTPLRHLVLIPLSRLFPTLEVWMAHMRQRNDLTTYLRRSANLTLITGPSKSADIEGNLTLGVHGPKIVHAILFDDIESLIKG